MHSFFSEKLFEKINNHSEMNLNMDYAKQDKEKKNPKYFYQGVRWTKRHYYIQPTMKADGELEYEERGVLPIILQKLLDKRNATKALKKK